MEPSDVLAVNLKNIRLERGLSLGQLAVLSGISKVMLSQIEKGETNPTINTIWKIAGGLKVSYTRLLEKNETEAVIIRKSPCLDYPSEFVNHRAFCYYTTTPTRDFELFTIELDAHSAFETVGHCEKSEEYVLVTRGELILDLGGKEYTLQEGDAIHFDGAVHHSYINRQHLQTTFIEVIYYR